jgi:hypothetical protein
LVVVVGAGAGFGVEAPQPATARVPRRSAAEEMSGRLIGITTKTP